MIASTLSVKYNQAKSQQGFSLIEMAIVLVILGMLLGGLIMPLSSQREVSQRQATERQLQEIRNALIGYAQVNNRLPCPAASGAGAAPSMAVACAPGDFVPYTALGIRGTIIGGNLVDVWQHPVHYRLANPAPGAWAYAIAIPTALAAAPYFQICPAAACPVVDADSVVAVVFSTSDDALLPSADELQNINPATNDFVRRTLDHGLNNFNDIVVWISQPTLIYELSRAGQ
jgi:prepilin-type N-terminal cleavage/methylation domain-containing protein